MSFKDIVSYSIKMVKNNSPNVNKNDLKNDLEQIVEIELDKLKNFEKHPFKVVDETLEELTTSITENGITTPLIVRPLKDGNYEIVSGHRRKRASELLAITKLPCIVRNISRDEAIIQMVDSNIQREEVLPSERAFAYKMKLDAMKHQGKRNDLTSSQVGKKLNTYEQFAGEIGESRNQIHRYIRITELVPELIDLVDSGEVSLRPAVELSYLPDEEQYMVLEAIETEVCTPSHAQTIRMRRMFDDGKLTQEAIEAIMQEEKPNQKEKLVIRNKRIWDLLPKNLERSQTEDYIVKAVEHYNKFLRKREQDRGR